MRGSQLIAFVDPLADKFSHKEAEKSQSDIQIGCETSKQLFLLKLRVKDSHMSPKKHLEKRKVGFHT